MCEGCHLTDWEGEEARNIIRGGLITLFSNSFSIKKNLVGQGHKYLNVWFFLFGWDLNLIPYIYMHCSYQLNLAYEDAWFKHTYIHDENI